MIIEIRDIPKDRKVKHITFDITFEEDNVLNLNKTNKCDIQSFNIKQDINNNTSIPVKHNEREYKEIPPEMTDMEF